jgi:hypothetical protein
MPWGSQGQLEIQAVPEPRDQQASGEIQQLTEPVDPELNRSIGELEFVHPSGTNRQLDLVGIGPSS